MFTLSSCTPAEQLGVRWHAYGNDNTLTTDWTGGDGGSSVRLPDGRTVWMFNDAYVDDTVNPDGSRTRSLFTVHNLVVIQNADGTLGTTLLNPQAGQPYKDFVQSPDPTSHYWLIDGTIEGSSLRLLVDEIKDGVGYVGSFVVSLSLPSLTVQGPAVPHPGYSGHILETSTHTYVYRSDVFEDPPGSGQFKSRTYAARVPAGHLADGTWEFWNGTAWVTTFPGDVGAIITTPGGLSYPGQVVQAGSAFVYVGLAGDKIVTAQGTSPIGPFAAPVARFTIPEATQTCGTSIFLTYHLAGHPQISSDPARSVFSYSVNCLDGAALQTDVRNYRPRYVEISLLP